MTEKRNPAGAGGDRNSLSTQSSTTIHTQEINRARKRRDLTEQHPILNRHWPTAAYRNVIPLPVARKEPAAPEECQELWNNAVAQRETADAAMRRFQSAFLSMPSGKGGAA
ncbi:MAG: hypothetical protein VB959_02045 [Rhodospirillales bacterium]